jgi:hypothetical protein
MARAASANMTAALNARQQVPRQKFRAPNGIGHFSGSLVRLHNGRGNLTWRLSYSRLSSHVTKAYLFVAKQGKKGQVAVELCTTCKPSASGKILKLPPSATKALLTRPAYVEIRTKKNPRGEIRGIVVR